MTRGLDFSLLLNMSKILIGGLVLVLFLACVTTSDIEVCRPEKAKDYKCPAETKCRPGTILMSAEKCFTKQSPCDLYKAQWNTCYKKYDGARCCNNYCGGCNAMWYCNGKLVDCFQK